MARYYDSEIGRFITRDTFLGFEDDPLSLNQYAYTKNNPSNYIDPSGHVKISRDGWAGFKIAMSHKETMTLVRGLYMLSAGASAIAIISMLIPDPTITKIVAVSFGLLGLSWGTIASIIWTYDDGFGVTIRAATFRGVRFESNTQSTKTW